MTYKHELNSNSTIKNIIVSKAYEIVNKISIEDINIYLYIMNRYRELEGKIHSDTLFQFIYKAYYQLNSAGLSDEFKNGYFQLMANLYKKEELDLFEICKSLEYYKNKKGQTSLQFSFCTKLAATINNRKPIYDSYVKDVFDFVQPQNKSYNIKLEKYIEFYKRLNDTVHNLHTQNEIIEIIEQISEKYANWKTISKEKQIDFIIWTTGKLIKKKK